MSFTVNCTLREIAEAPELAPYNKYLMYANPYLPEDQPKTDPEMTLSFSSMIGWSPEGIAAGLNYLEDKLARGQTEQFFLYADEEGRKAEEQKQEVNLIWVKPETPNPERKVVLLVSDGGYQAISMMVDGLPCVRHFSEQGYQVFLLTYRIGENQVLPKALEDVASAVKFLAENSSRFGIDLSTLVIAGYSAGANLVAAWQLPEVGYRAFALPAPKCALLVYGVFDLEEELQNRALPDMRRFMLGDDFMISCRKYNPTYVADEGFPPTYLICGAADGLVSPMNSRLLKARLDQVGVRSVLEIVPDTDHGFGDGTGTKAADWLLRADVFINSL